MAQATKTKPAHEVRLGRVKATIWKNETENGDRYNTTVKRLYRDDDGWHTTDSLGRDDLPVAEKVLNLAYLWIHAQSEKEDEA